MLADPKALHHVFQASGYRYPKTHDTNQAIRLMMGRGIFWAVGTTIFSIDICTALCDPFSQVMTINAIKRS